MDNFILQPTTGGLWLGSFPALTAMGVEHGFSTRFGGCGGRDGQTLDLGWKTGKRESVIEDRRRFFEAMNITPEQVVTICQVHGTRAVQVDSSALGRSALAPESSIGEADALFTNEKQVGMLLGFADCVPVLLFDPIHRALAVVHAGWRGTVDLIAQKTLLMMQSAFGSEPERCFAAIGPSIGPCCYEVDAPVIEAVKRIFPKPTSQLLFPGNDSDHAKLDLWQANSEQLLAIGVKEKHIFTSHVCTAHHHQVFHSHRAESGAAGRMGLLAWLK